MFQPILGFFIPKKCNKAC